MFEIAAIVLFIASIVEWFEKSNKSMEHFIIGILLIIASRIIKTHSEVVQIRRYIGDYKKFDEIWKG